jgi:hypothetical protein
MTTNERSASAKDRILSGLFAAGMGGFILLMSFGIRPIELGPGEGPLWLMSVVGAMVLLVGIAVAVGAMQGASSSGELPQTANGSLRLFYYVAGLLAVGGLAILGSWVALGPGERAISGPFRFLLSRHANEIVGRTVFGFGAILTWWCLVAFVVAAARKLFARKSGQWDSSPANSRGDD